MKLDVYNLKNEKVGEIEVSDAVFGAEVKPHLHHEVVRYQLAKRRAGTHKAKTRSDVHGTTKKMYKQKGTGRARHGARKAPQFRGGGGVFRPMPRDHGYVVPRKVKAGALRSALSEKVRDGALKVVSKIEYAVPKTRAAAADLAKLGAGLGALVIDLDNTNLSKSLRNLPNTKFLPPAGVNVYDVLNYRHLVITEEAVRQIDGRLSS